ncbi:MAG: aldehyde ferredoxin oxidoreductase family protein [Promethearchaeota archaeon]
MTLAGFRGKLLVVDLSAGTISTEPLKEEFAENFLGGAGYAVRYLYDAVTRETDPLGPDNPLLFMTGPLTGTRAPTAGRWVVCAKSPKTGLWGESNCGGYFGAELKFTGHDGILVTGASENPVYLHVTESGAELRDASSIWGLGTYATHAKLKEAVGDPLARVACVGPAGERMVPYAIVASEERAAGRTGMGAVMGSKKLKAIVLRGKDRKIPLAKPGEFSEAAKAAHKEVMEPFTTQMFKELGTSGGVDLYNVRGELPIKYYCKGSFPGSYNISGATMKERILVKNRHCYACPIGCGRVVKVDGGKYDTGGVVEGPEYETIAGFGSMLLVDDIEAIAKANFLCNDLGLDTISCSTTVAFCYHLYEKGVVTAGDLDGLELKWGDPDPALALIRKIANREGVGDLLAGGANAVADRFGVSREEASTVYGLEVTYHDLRSCYGMAIAYACGPRGPSHNACDMYQTALGQPFPEIDIPSPDMWDEGNVMTDSCAKLMDYRAFYSSLVMCSFCNPATSTIVKLLNLATGLELNLEDVKTIGMRVLEMKRLFNVKMGLDASWDRLPEILTRPLDEGGSAGKSPNWKQMLKQFYEYRQWDPQTGAPSEEKCRRLGLPLE